MNFFANGIKTTFRDEKIANIPACQVAEQNSSFARDKLSDGGVLHRDLKGEMIDLHLSFCPNISADSSPLICLQSEQSLREVQTGICQCFLFMALEYDL